LAQIGAHGLTPIGVKVAIRWALPAFRAPTYRSLLKSEQSFFFYSYGKGFAQSESIGKEIEEARQAVAPLSSFLGAGVDGEAGGGSDKEKKTQMHTTRGSVSSRRNPCAAPL
jgi:hypothetical protein